MCTSALLSLADSGLSLHHLDMLAFFLQTHMRARAHNLLLLGLTCLTLVHLTQSATRTYGSSCSSCNRGPSASFLGGQALGSNVRGVLGNKLEHIAGFFNGLGGGGGAGCGGAVPLVGLQVVVLTMCRRPTRASRGPATPPPAPPAQAPPHPPTQPQLIPPTQSQ